MKKIIKFALSVIITTFAMHPLYANKDYEELDSIIAIVEKDVITKKVIANRSTFFCNTCQN